MHFSKNFHQTLNAHIFLTKVNQKLIFVLFDSKKCFLHICIIFGAPRPRGLTAGGSAPYNPRLGHIWPIVLKGLTPKIQSFEAHFAFRTCLKLIFTCVVVGNVCNYTIKATYSSKIISLGYEDFSNLPPTTPDWVIYGQSSLKG